MYDRGQRVSSKEYGVSKIVLLLRMHEQEATDNEQRPTENR